MGGKSRALAAPFFVLATQNPIEQEGTYSLPEAQLDRFMFQLLIDYPTEQEELEIVQRTTGVEQQSVQQVVGSGDIQRAIALVREMPVAAHVIQFAIHLARRSRPDDEASDFVRQHVAWGAGPRSSQFLVLGAKAHALLHGSLSVDYQDIIAVAHSVLRHRIRLNYAATASQVTADDIIDRVIQELKSSGSAEFDNPSTLTGDQRDQSSKVFRTEDASST